jgi:16S rRNA C1402 N4-methylase RsmH
MSEMTITEGLKKLKLIEKRIQKNCAEIVKYSSLLSTERPIFETENKQREEVSKLIQANTDLELEYCRIKAMIDYTNLMIYVQIDDENRSIHDWLTLLRKTGKLLIQTYESLTDKDALTRITMRNLRDKETTNPTIVRLYDENTKRNNLRKWEDLIAGKTIEGRLEVINATTKLMTPP